jgi:hypothetical protein
MANSLCGMERRGVIAVLAAAVACLVVAATGAYGMYAVLDEHAFADRAVGTLKSDEIREEAGTRTALAVVLVRPELRPGQMAVEDAATAEANDPAYDAAFRTAAARLHHALLRDANAEASLRIDGSGAALHERLIQIPGWEHMAPIEDPSLLTVDTSGFEGALRTLAPAARELAPALTIVFGIAGLGLLGLGIARARRRLWCAGMTVAATAGLLAAGATAGRDVVLHQFDTGFGEAVVRQVWDAYLGDLRAWALMAGAAGLIVAAASGGPRLSVRLATPLAGARRLALAGGLLAVAALAVTLPELVLHVALVSVAGALVYVAAGVLSPPRALASPS